MKDVLLAVMRADAPLMAMIPDDRWLERGSVTDAPQILPFGVVAARGAAPVRSAGRFRQNGVEFWIHDERGSYDRINQIIGRLVEVLDGRSHLEGENEYVLSVEYQSESPDLEDDGYRTNTRSVSFLVVARFR